jgi:hypothetical protein
VANHGEARHEGRGLLTGSLRRCGHVVLGAVVDAPSAVTQANSGVVRRAPPRARVAIEHKECLPRGHQRPPRYA